MCDVRHGTRDHRHKLFDRRRIDLLFAAYLRPEIDGLFQYAFARRDGLSTIPPERWVAGQKPKAVHIAEQHDARLRQVMANLIVLFG